ncbi:MAG: hypothetical protein V3T39_03175 [Gammaproteobacteria bacterium]
MGDDDTRDNIPLLEEAVGESLSDQTEHYSKLFAELDINREDLHDELTHILNQRMEEILDETIREIEVVLVEKLAARLRIALPEIVDEAFKKLKKTD